MALQQNVVSTYSHPYPPLACCDHISEIEFEFDCAVLCYWIWDHDDLAGREGYVNSMCELSVCVD